MIKTNSSVAAADACAAMKPTAGTLRLPMVVPIRSVAVAVLMIALSGVGTIAGCASSSARSAADDTIVQQQDGEPEAAATQGDGAVGAADAAPPAEPVLPDPRGLTIIDGHSGVPMTWTTMLGRLSLADIVIVGEQHGHPMGLHAAAEIWADLLERSPYAGLSMEFFERDEQVALDDYFGGITDTAGFEKAAGRASGNYPPGHRRMVELAKERERPVIASNAPRRYVRLARMQGFDALRALTSEQQRLFVIPDELPDGPYKQRFYDVMGGMMMSHGSPKSTATADGEAEGSESEGGSESEQEAPGTDAEEVGMPPEVIARIDAFYRSQVMWEATMAASVLRGLESGLKPVVHVVGQFHSDYEGGLMEQLDLMGSNIDVVTISMVNDWSSTRREEDEGRADFVIYVGPAEAHGMPPAMAGQTKRADGDTTIAAVAP